MKIGLVRHFKVNLPHEIMMTSEEFRDWCEKYENAGVLKKRVNMYGTKWDICYSSDMKRAFTTAKEVYSGKVMVDKLLREVDNMPFVHSDRLRLPFYLWHICGRLAWFFKSNSQPEGVRETRRRIKKFLRQIDWDKENILIVSHGFLIFNITWELFRLGFIGKKVRRVRNGILYEYQYKGSKEKIRKKLFP